ncbi:hypothetical protein [Pseudescherichia sp.]|uniref:RCC1 domain-containing protein n=1 Tax=Pseudescherichia sp. TaxID=2055881 RepID=UPI00289913D1|nr:hypothetical protein [Pseudescherichia sp.]
MAKSLLIMGNRTQGAGCFNLSYARIVSLDADTLTPVFANWQYEGESLVTQGTAFYDHNSVNRLIVSADGYASVILNAGNVDIFRDDIVNVVNNDKQIKQWGNVGYVTKYPIADADNHDFQKVTVGNECSFAIRTDKSLYAWGNPQYGGQLKPTTQSRNDIQQVMPSGMAGILRGSSSPYIEEWGYKIGGDFALPDEIASMDNIIDLVCNDNVRTVLTSDGKIYAWGNYKEGAIVPDEIAELTDITAVYVNSMSVCVLRRNGQVAAWGVYDAGGTVPDDIAALTDIVRVYPGYLSYVALRENGSIVVWGRKDEYVDFPDDIAALTNIVDVRFCSYAGGQGTYILLCDDGSVRGFGTEVTDLLPIPDGLTDVVALTGVSAYCSALKKDGSVVNWGNNAYLDDSQVRESLVNVRAIYGSAYCMVALTRDDSLVVWGESESGDPMDLIPDGVQGNISYMQPYEI